jgi:protein phosphatase
MSTPEKNIEIPDFSLIVLIGSTGSGKSTFAAKHFLPTEAISSDYCRALVSDSETDLDVTGDAFDLVREIAGKRLKHRKLAVIDATNVRPADRKGWIALARQWHALPVAIVFDPGIDVCIERNKVRPDRAFGGQVATDGVGSAPRSRWPSARGFPSGMEACQCREHRSRHSHASAPLDRQAQ